MPRTLLRKIIWAVGPEGVGGRAQGSAVAVLRALSAKGGTSIDPVHVFTWKEEDLSGTCERLKRALQDVQLPGLRPLVVLRQKGVYLRSDTEALTRYARKSGANLIVAASHARRGLSRLWLGSFAETLLLHSKVPLILVNPSAQVATRFRSLLFPTDLSPKSRKAFHQVIEFASALNTRITLYHRLETYSPLTGMEISVTGAVAAALRLQKQQVKHALLAWAKEASHQGVPSKIQVDSRQGNLTEAIVSRAQRSPGTLIAMAAQSGPIASILVGSLARQIVRRATCPVWLFRP